MSAFTDRFSLVSHDLDLHREEFARDVRAGLTASPKRLACRYFYDEDGSALFEEICTLPEYYLTRAEREIIERRAPEIAVLCDVDVVVELGSGSAGKTRFVIDALLARRGALRYVPIDISREILEASSRELIARVPALEVLAIAGDYDFGLKTVREKIRSSKLVLWLGSNIGNFGRHAAAEFLRDIRDMLSADDRLLVGIDLRKDRAILERAYDDSRGVTARFNLNLLDRINRELAGHFDLESFTHRAVYDEDLGRVEMYLRSSVAQSVPIDELGVVIDFEAGESVHTENSYKWSLAEIRKLADEVGFGTMEQWLDGEERFSLNLLVPGSA